MPPKPSWFRRIPQMQATVESLDVPFLDRAALEKLFRVSRRRAVTLAHTIGVGQLGHALVVSRDDLLSFLSNPQFNRARTIEKARRQRLREVIEEAQRNLAARSVKIAVAASPRDLEQLPPTVALSPGELRIKFDRAEDLLRQLYLLSQTMGRNYAAFEALVTVPSEGGTRESPAQGTPGEGRR